MVAKDLVINFSSMYDSSYKTTEKHTEKGAQESLSNGNSSYEAEFGFRFPKKIKRLHANLLQV